MKLANRNVIVTGGSQGLGRAIVEACVREGASVLLCARDEAAATELADILRAHVPSPASQQVLAQGCDVAREEEVEALFTFADEAFAATGGTHALINNAGIYGPKGPTEEVSLEEWRRCIDINLYGTLHALAARTSDGCEAMRDGGRAPPGARSSIFPAAARPTRCPTSALTRRAKRRSCA